MQPSQVECRPEWPCMNTCNRSESNSRLLSRTVILAAPDFFMLTFQHWGHSAKPALLPNSSATMTAARGAGTSGRPAACWVVAFYLCRHCRTCNAKVDDAERTNSAIYRSPKRGYPTWRSRTSPTCCLFNTKIESRKWRDVRAHMHARGNYADSSGHTVTYHQMGKQKPW